MAAKKSAIERGMGHPESAADDFIKGVVGTAAKVLKKKISPKKINEATRFIKSTASQEAYLAHASKQYPRIKGSSAVENKLKGHMERTATVRSLRVGDRKESLNWRTMDRLGIADHGIKAKGINKAYQDEYNDAAAKFAAVRKRKVAKGPNTLASKIASKPKPPVKKAPAKKVLAKKVTPKGK